MGLSTCSESFDEASLLCCSVLQFVARVLQCSVGHGIEWGSQSIANVSMRCLPTLSRVLQCVAVRCTCVAVYCRVLI